MNQPSIVRKWRAMYERIADGESEASVLDDYGLFTKREVARIIKTELDECVAICEYNEGQSSHPMNFADQCAKDIKRRSKRK